MDVDNSWDAVFRPHVATSYFEAHGALRPEPGGTRFDTLVAWWMAEMSRLVYRLESDEAGETDRTRTRNAILRDVGFTEMAFIDVEGSQAAVIAPLSPPDYVIVAFRGSDDIQAWIDFNAPLALVTWPAGGKVHLGFKTAFEHVWTPLQAHLPTGVPRFYTGHSLGGALAALAVSVDAPSGGYSFGAPRVGTRDFADATDDGAFYRVVNHTDIVTELPPGLSHVGQLRYISHDGSILTEPTADLVFSDRLRPDPTFDLQDLLRRQVAAPPQVIADHAPINYVAHLERAVRTSR